jgi:hypothetical protein
MNRQPRTDLSDTDLSDSEVARGGQTALGPDVPEALIPAYSPDVHPIEKTLANLKPLQPSSTGTDMTWNRSRDRCPIFSLRP